MKKIYTWQAMKEVLEYLQIYQDKNDGLEEVSRISSPSKKGSVGIETIIYHINNPPLTILRKSETKLDNPSWQRDHKIIIAGSEENISQFERNVRNRVF